MLMAYAYGIAKSVTCLINMQAFINLKTKHNTNLRNYLRNNF